MTTVHADSVRDELVRRLSSLSAGEVEVTGVEVSDEYWADDPNRSVRVIVRLSDPRGATWPLDDMDVIRRAVFDAFVDLDILPNVRFRLTGGTRVANGQSTEHRDE